MDPQSLEIGEEAGPCVRLLIVKFSSIGDCVMAVPAASMFKRAYPEGKLVWAVDPRCEAVIEEGLAEKFSIPWEVWKRDKVSSLARMRHYLSLRRFRFDFGVDLQGHSKTAICLRLSGARRRLTVRPFDPLAKMLNTTANVDPDLHIVERNIDVLQLLGIDHPNQSPIMPDVSAPADLPANLVSIAVSTGHPKKNLPPEVWGEVARVLIAQGHPVAFVGGPTDTAPAVPGALDFCAKLNLKETMGVLRASRLHIAGDTGSGHICAAYGVPVVSVFGPTNADHFRPYGPKTVVLQADDKMQGIGVSDILAAAQEALA